MALLSACCALGQSSWKFNDVLTPKVVVGLRHL